MYHLYNWTRQSLVRNHLTRHYEPLQPHLLMALARRFECQTFVDVGANVGAYSLLMTGVPSIKSIHAFEASPDTFEHLQRNVRLNGVDIHLHNQAASDARGVLAFGIVNALSGANSVIETSLHRMFQRQVEVKAAPLDDSVNLEDERVCIKVDVEGHELQVLAGMKKMLRQNEVILQIEDYAKAPEIMEKRLEPYGLRSLFRIGADRYFTSVKPHPAHQELTAIFEAAAEGLVQTSLGTLQQWYVDGEAPLDLRLGGSVTVQLRGTPASVARSLSRRVRAVLRPMAAS